MNRKNFLQKLSLALPTVLLSPAVLSSGCKPTTDPNSDTKKKTVVIIGAGIAGLGAARTLKNKGFTVIVLEARARTGGRIFTDRSLGSPMDMGASWIHGIDGNPLGSLAEEAGAFLFQTNDNSLVVYDRNGNKVSDTSLTAYENAYANLISGINNTGTVQKSVRQAVQDLNPSYLLDDMMVWQLTTNMEFNTGGAIEQLSSKYWEDDLAFPGKDKLFPNGYDAIIRTLESGLDIRKGTVVKSIDYGSSDITVRTADGEVKGDFCICTAPLGVLKKGSIGFAPALPSVITDSWNKIQMGAVNKVVLLFSNLSRFWDDVQYIGYTDPTKGKFPYFMNIKKFSPNVNGLMTFALGSYAATMETQTDAQITADIMVTLKKIYGNNIPNPTQTLVSRWSADKFAYGAYSYASVNSTPQDFNNMALSVQNKLFFAGEHTSHDYRGTVHGAYLSGVAAANSVANQ